MLKIRIKNFLWRLTLKYLVNPKKVVNIGGNKMYLDLKDSLLLSVRKNYEPKHLELMKKIVKEGDVVIDIGAHIGYYTLLLAKLVGPKGKVFAFEPNPENFKVLKKNIELNGYKNVVLEQKGISNKNTKTKFYFSKVNTGDGRVYKITGEERESCEVELIRLDDYFRKKRLSPSFFKIDIQGFEPAAFEGMNLLLNNSNLKFTTEFQPGGQDYGIKSAGYNPKEFLDKIQKKGFNIIDLDKNKVITDNDALIKYYININYFTTLYCYR
jgi:FkbM family methyltransferase